MAGHPGDFGRKPLDFHGLVIVDGQQDHLGMFEGLNRTGRSTVVVAGGYSSYRYGDVKQLDRFAIFSSIFLTRIFQ